MPRFEKHIFVCGNQRPAGHPRGSCDPLAEAKLQKLFKQKLAERGLKGRVRANQSGCLDQCEHGPNVVVYPEAIWYGPSPKRTSTRLLSRTSSEASPSDASAWPIPA